MAQNGHLTGGLVMVNKSTGVFQSTGIQIVIAG